MTENNKNARQLIDGNTVIIGNVTGDPELRYTQAGLAVANFTVAYADRVRNPQTNEFEEGESTFMRVSVWREYAEHVAASLAKGNRVVVKGKSFLRGWTDKEGNPRSSLELDADAVAIDLRFGTATFQRAQPRNQQQGNVQPQPAAQQAQPAAQQQFVPQPAQPGAQQFQPQQAQQPVVQQFVPQQVQQPVAQVVGSPAPEVTF